MPMIIASAVMITGRSRPAPACQAAARGSRPLRKLFRANVTTSTEFDVATPRLMMAPISAGTLSVVCASHSPQTTPAAAPGSAVMMMNGSIQL